MLRRATYGSTNEILNFPVMACTIFLEIIQFIFETYTIHEECLNAQKNKSEFVVQDNEFLASIGF